MLVNIHKHAWLLLIFLASMHPSPAQVYSLQQCIDTAMLNNHSLKMGRNARDIADLKHKEARAGLMPKLSANAEYKYFTNLPYQLLPLSALNPAAPEGEFREAQFGVPHNINASLQLVFPLYNPQIESAIEKSKIAGELSHLRLEKSREEIVYEVTNLYFNAQILLHQLSFAEGNLANAKRLAKNVEILHQQTLAKTSDINKAELQAELLLSQKQTIEQKLQQVINALKFVTGIDTKREIQVDPAIEFNPSAEYQKNQIIDYRMAQTEQNVHYSDLRSLNKTMYLPTLNILATYGTTGFGYDKGPDSFLNFYPIGFAGLQLSYPLFHGFVNTRKKDQKQLEISNATLQMHLIAEKNQMEIKNALLQKMNAIASVEDTRRQIKLAQSILEETYMLQKQGLATITEILLADNDLRAAQQANVSAIVDFLKAELEIKKTSGNLFPANY